MIAVTFVKKERLSWKKLQLHSVFRFQHLPDSANFIIDGVVQGWNDV